MKIRFRTSLRAGLASTIACLTLVAAVAPPVQAQAGAGGIVVDPARFRRRAPGEIEDKVVSYFLRGAIPTRFNAPAWNRIRAVQIWVPREYDHPDVDEPIVPPTDPALRPPLKSMLVKSLHNGQRIYFWFEWADTTQDTTVQSPPLFADAFALQVPFDQVTPPPPEIDPITGLPVLDPVTGLPVPGGIHMGASGYPVNILFWRADLGKVQNATGVGEGSVQVTPVPGDAAPVPAPAPLDIEHSQVFRGNKWNVVIGRPMRAQNPEIQAAFMPGTTIPIAWSIWDGFFKERNGNKYANGLWDKLVIQATR